MSAVPGSPKVTRCTSKPAAFEDIFKHAERAGIGRSHRGAAHQVAGNGEGISHVMPA